MLRKLFCFIYNLFYHQYKDTSNISSCFSVSYDSEINTKTNNNNNFNSDIKNINSNRLSYHVNKIIDTYNNLDSMDISEYHTTDRKDNKIVLVNILDLKLSFSKHGTIYAFSETGKIGVFYYN